MKKIMSLVMVLVMAVFMLAACGNGSGSSDSSDSASVDSLKTIGDVIALESDATQCTVYEDVVVYAFKLGDTYYRAKAPISKEIAQAYFDIDLMDEDYEQQQVDILTPLEISEIENLSEKILSQDEIDALVGKTGQELQDAGWTYNGHDLEKMEFWMNYGPFLYTVTFDGEIPESDYETFEDEAGTKDMTVKSIEVSGLGDGATDIETE